MYWAEHFPSNIHVDMEPVSRIQYRNRIFAQVIKLKRGHTGLQWALVQDLCSYKKIDNLEKYTKRTSCDDASIDYSVKSEKVPRITSNPQKLKERHGTDSPTESPRRNQP